MYVERLKRWQWMIVGVILGCVVATVKLWGGMAEPPKLETVAPHIFETQLIEPEKDPSRKRPMEIQQVILHPHEEVIVPGAKERQFREVVTYWVQYPATRKDKDKDWEITCHAHPRAFILTQDAGQKSVLGDISKMTGREYLDKLKNHIRKLDKAKYPYAKNFEYRYAWLETPRGAYTTFGVAGLAIVGLVWPTIINLLVGAGYGRPVTDDEDDKYLARFKGKSAPHKPIKVGMTEADLAELAAMEARLEAQLKDSGLAMTDKKPGGKSKETAAQTAEKAAKKFTGAAAEELKTAATKAEAHKDFGQDQGDYYPTEVHGKHK